MRFYTAKFPAQNDIVFVKIKNISHDKSVYVELLEYDNISGLILPTEIHKKNINVHKIFNVGNKVYPAVVMNVDIAKNHVDLSYKRVPEASKEALETTYVYYQRISTMVNDIYILYKKYYNDNETDELISENILWQLFTDLKQSQETAEQYYNNLLINPSNIFKFNELCENKLDEKFIDFAFDNIKQRIKSSDVIIFSEIKLIVIDNNPIQKLKDILTNCLLSDKVSVEYVASPKYKIIIVESTYDRAKVLLDQVLENIKNNPIKKQLDYYGDIKIQKNKTYQLAILK
jgi:translation initiation factor 2 alpha subunit (eIF-2alpha)